ncbi:hypothetical protein BGZ79_010172 [Entomortierella chlamydospora]|nr:hypothetical protein BGZ79_010172 [Entomortierella chlamydospora]
MALRAYYGKLWQSKNYPILSADLLHENGIGTIQAVTNQQPGLNIATEHVIGYMLPGHAIANITSKIYGYIVYMQVLTFTSDLKLGYCMKMSLRVMFMAQLISTLISGVINLSTAVWLVNIRPKNCTKDDYSFTRRNTNTFYSPSIIWGAIGPARIVGAADGAICSAFSGVSLSAPSILSLPGSLFVASLTLPG